MKAVVTLAPGLSSATIPIGETIKLQISSDEKLEAGDFSIVQAEPSSPWVLSGNLILDTKSIRPLPSDNLTKLEISGIVHSPGELKVGPLQLRHSSGKEMEIPETVLQELRVEESQQQQSPNPWTLPGLSFGTWNYFLLGTLLILFLAVIAYFTRKYLKRIPFQKKLNPLELALRELNTLESYGKSGRTLNQQDWKKFSFSLASTLRTFTGKNRNFDGRDRTDREFLEEMKKNGSTSKEVESLRSILETIDAVRYGEKALDSHIAPSLIESGKKFVESTYIQKEKEGKQ